MSINDQYGRPLQVLTILAVVTGAVFSSGGYAAEGITPFKPGASTGAAAGALPRQGFYLNLGTDFISNTLKNGSGDNASPSSAVSKVSVTGQSTAVQMMWVPGWEVWGGRYAMSVLQPYKWVEPETSFSAGGSSKSSVDGMVNTAIKPAIISWNMGEGYHVSTGLTVVLDNGYFNSSGGNIDSTNSVGNNYWTIEPSFAVSYLKNGWNLTANNLFDYNFENSETNYKTGMTYYLDLTATKKTNAWTYGLVGNYTQQITDDEKNGVSVAEKDGMYSKGRRVQHVMAGAMLAYNFGSFSLSGRYTADVKTKNAMGVSFFHIGLSIPFN